MVCRKKNSTESCEEKKKLTARNAWKAVWVEGKRYASLDELLQNYPNRMGCLKNEYYGKLFVDKVLEAMSYNEYYRAFMKEEKVGTLTSTIWQEFPGLQEFISLDDFGSKLKKLKEGLGEVTIVRLGCDEGFELGGYVYRGIRDLKMQCQNRKHPNFIFQESERFPCFDSSDYAYENRYYRNFWVCRSEAEKRRKEKFVNEYPVRKLNCCYVSEDMPLELRPMVYYRDEDTVMLVVK